MGEHAQKARKLQLFSSKLLFTTKKKNHARYVNIILH